MIPQQTFESYPVFGDNATKVKPDDAKYAAGFQQADVLPAEWMNWAWAKNSKGITDANAGLSSIEEEIINVLTSRGKTPSASDNTQLLTVLNMIKAEAALAAHPVGSLYWTSSTENPATTFGGGTWTQIKDKFVLAAGDTYANGNTGGAATVTLTADQIPSHNHSFTPAGSVSVTTNPTFTGSSHSHSYTPAGTVSKHTHSVGAHAHGLNSHTHSVTAAGTISITTNPTFTGSAVTSGAMSGNSTGGFRIYDSNISVEGNTSLDKRSSATTTSVIDTTSSNANWWIKNTISHTHSVTAAGSISGGAYKFTGSAVTSGQATGSTANSTAFNSGETQPTFTGTAATLTATQGGTISGGAYSFTGTAGNTGSKGGGGAHNNMPPYVVKYCWERTA